MPVLIEYFIQQYVDMLSSDQFSDKLKLKVCSTNCPDASQFSFFNESNRVSLYPSTSIGSIDGVRLNPFEEAFITFF